MRSSFSAFDLVLIDAGNGLEVSHPTGSSALTVLGLERPAV